MDWKRLPHKLLSCWVADGAKGVRGGELTYGKSIENVLRRCTHAFEHESSDTTTHHSPPEPRTGTAAF
jgi:hypothetical protein